MRTSNETAVELKVYFSSKGKKETMKVNTISFFLVLFYFKLSKTNS
jgi:hypothetical protein